MGKPDIAIQHNLVVQEDLDDLRGIVEQLQENVRALKLKGGNQPAPDVGSLSAYDALHQRCEKLEAENTKPKRALRQVKNIAAAELEGVNG